MRRLAGKLCRRHHRAHLFIRIDFDEEEMEERRGYQIGDRCNEQAQAKRPGHTAPENAAGQMFLATSDQFGRQDLNAQQDPHAKSQSHPDRQPGVQDKGQLMLLAFHLAEHDRIRQAHQHPRQA